MARVTKKEKTAEKKIQKKIKPRSSKKIIKPSRTKSPVRKLQPSFAESFLEIAASISNTPNPAVKGNGSQGDSRESIYPFHKTEMKPWQRMQELPANYGDNLIYLLVRDPHWIYAYWEIQIEHQQKTLARLGGSWDDVRSVLRVYDITERRENAPFFDINLQGLAANWYIEAQPNRSYVVEIGLLHRDGRFLALARSNEVTTPRAGMSDILDEHWMGIDFDKMYALSGGFQVGNSSMELRKLMEERLRGAISSGSGAGVISSGSPVRIKKERGFWFVLDCELIVYGATEPDATVTLQGQSVKLRPDGTFTLRFSLPDGKQVLDAHAFSADGIEERIIVPIVERATERPAPVLKS